MELVLSFYRLDHNNCQVKTQVVETSISIQWLRLPFPMQGEWVQFVVGELKSPIVHGQKNKSIKQKQNYNKFKKDFFNGLHLKKNLKSQVASSINHFLSMQIEHVDMYI